MDRIDLHVRVPAVETEKLASSPVGQLSSQVIREQVIKARKTQEIRLKNFSIYTNAQMKNKLVKQFCKLDGGDGKIIKISSGKT